MQRFLGSRRRLFGVAAGATLLATMGARQAGAAGAGPNGLQRLVEHPKPMALPEGLTFTDGEGRMVDFTAFRGRALVVNFWATWCAPCVAEMPALDRLVAQVKDAGIEVLALSNDRGGLAQVQPFYQRTGIANLGIWLDPRGATGRALNIRVLPTTLLIDRRGEEVARLMGDAAWDAPEMIAAIRRLTRTAAAPAPTTRS